MATGRGWIHRQHQAILEERRARGGADTKTQYPAAAGSLPRNSGVKLVHTNIAIDRIKTYGVQRHQISYSKSHSYLDSLLPSEILLKILSYLDSVSLLCMGCVNKRFYELCNDNMLWRRIYSSLLPPKKSQWVHKAVETANIQFGHNTIQEKDSGYWKKEYISKVITAGKNALINLLKPVNHYTGLPANTKAAVKAAGLSWMLTLKEKSGKEHVIEQVEVSFNDTSITVLWYGSAWPCLGSLKTLQLQGVTPVLPFRSRVPNKNGPRRRSLISEYDLTNLKGSSILLGCDKLVHVSRLNPGLLLGLWKDGSEIAFVMASLHYHQLLQRSTLGSANMPFVLPEHKPLLDDVDSQYGLHDYQLHIDLHSGDRTYMCGTFSHLFSKKDYICNGFLKLTVISVKNNKQHAPLSGQIELLWKTDAFRGIVQNCLMMDITLLDETEKPFWCLSAPVNIQGSANSHGLYDFMGPHFVLNYGDLEGKVHMELVWMKDTEEYCIINLVIYVSTDKVNSWFGTAY